ncbi:uncharacterized protein [Aegilops tauschii subsp. strangulata]|uniref:uncharacterized protein n=1 Tax=Aegilops tauschii subsp. strangulata TaxID=200361 RepID=UPI00098AB4F5|nr:uncharacterized protein LOC109769283 [Aegilops tauschii subsp. strangulata]
MVFEDERSDDYSSLQYIKSSNDGMQYQIPASIEDQDYMGIETAPQGFCVEHRLPVELRVAFEGFETDTRFLVCAQPGAKESRAEVTSAAVTGMKTEMEKKEAENLKLQEKYVVLTNLVEAQGSVIRNLKMNHLKQKEKLSEYNRNLKV